jgi:hypothetical protein
MVTFKNDTILSEPGDITPDQHLMRGDLLRQIVVDEHVLREDPMFRQKAV